MSSFSAELLGEANAIQRKINAAIRRKLEILFERFKEATPVDTGALKDSWSMQLNEDNSGFFLASAKYATFVNEEGRLFVDKVDLIVREANAAPPEEL